MSRKPMSRRAFLQLGAEGLKAAAGFLTPPVLSVPGMVAYGVKTGKMPDSAFALGASLRASLELGGCAPAFEPPSELKRKSFDQETAIFNGKTVSVNELGMEPMAFYSGVRERLSRIVSGDRSAATVPQGYAGAAFPVGYELDASKTTIIINQTTDGDFISQAIIGRKAVGSNPLSGDGSFNSFINGIVGATAYNEHSLLVVGRGDRALWFDNIESKTDAGRARVVVDGGLGKIYQIATNKPNFIEDMVQGQEVEMIISEINVKARETGFTEILTPMSEAFIGFLQRFINRLPTNLTKDEKLDKIRYFFSGTQLSSADSNEMMQLLGGGDEVQQMINAMNRFHTNIPFDNAELAFANAAIAKNVKKLLSEGIIGDWSQKIKNVIPTGESVDLNVVNSIMTERIGLPMAAPEVYLVQVKNEDGALKWFAVGRYPVWENDVDRTVVSPNPNGYSIGQGWFTYGEVGEEIVDNISLRPYEKIVDGFPFDQVKNGDSNQNKPLVGGVFGGLYSLIEARQVGAEAIRYGYDPAEGNTNHKINPGFFISDDGEDRFLKLTLDNVWGSNIKDLPRLSNRPLPLLGNSPRVIKDVTEDVSDLIAKGQINGSPFLLDDYADFALLANMTGGPDGFLNYDFINNALSVKALETLVSPGTFIQGGADNSILIYSNTPAGEQINISVYNNATGQKVGDIPVSHPVIVAPLEIGEFIDGSGFIKIAEDGDTGETYVVREEDIFPLGARSSAKLTAIAVGEAALTIAAIYGGYQLIAGKAILGKGLVDTLAKILVH